MSKSCITCRSCGSDSQFERLRVVIRCAMARALAFSLLMEVATEQRARNLVFPEAIESPIVFGCLSAICNQLRQVLAVPGCPVTDLPGLLAFFELVSVEVALAMGQACHNEFRFVDTYPRIPEQDRINALHQMEVEMRALVPAMVRWRMALSSASASRWDHLTEGLLVVLGEITYFGRFDVLELLMSCFRQFYMKRQEAEEALARDPGVA